MVLSFPESIFCVRIKTEACGLHAKIFCLHERGDMYYCIYASSASRHLPDHELMDIKEQSRVANQELGITGLLVLHRSVFIHYFEGEQSAIKKIVSALKKDKRLKDVKVIGEGELGKRQFSDWSMELRVLDKDPLFTASDLTNDEVGIKKVINDYFLSIK